MACHYRCIVLQSPRQLILQKKATIEITSGAQEDQYWRQHLGEHQMSRRKKINKWKSHELEPQKGPRADWKNSWKDVYNVVGTLECTSKPEATLLTRSTDRSSEIFDTKCKPSEPQGPRCIYSALENKLGREMGNDPVVQKALDGRIGKLPRGHRATGG